MRRLTVVQLLPALDAGGVEQSTLEIADALVRAGHRAIVVSAGGRLQAPLEAAGAEHIRLDIGRKSPLSLRHVPALRRLFRERGADIVHARSRLPAWLGWLALRGMPEAARPRFVTTVHGLNSPSRYSAIMARGERVVCVSQSVRAHVLRHYPATDPRCLRVIPRGIDPAAFPRVAGCDPAARAAIAEAHPALGGEGPLLLLPGRGTRLKGHADAIGLLARLRAGGQDARLWMPGARAAAVVAAARQALLLGLGHQIEPGRGAGAVLVRLGACQVGGQLLQAYAQIAGGGLLLPQRQGLHRGQDRGGQARLQAGIGQAGGIGQRAALDVQLRLRGQAPCLQLGALRAGLVHGGDRRGA